MNAQTILEARLRGRDDGLVGQLTATAQQSKAAAGGLNEMAGAARNASTATNAVAASDREAARAAREVERARKDHERAARAAARAEQQAANEIAKAQNRLRAGQFQLGQQAQDFFIQWQAGTPLLTAFSQQASQASGAIALMGGEVDKNSSKLAKFANIMGGPVGIAIGVAIPLVSMLAAKLFENAEASAAAEAGSNGLAAAQTALGEVFDLVSGKLKSQNDLLILNARLQAINLRAEAATERSKAEGALRPQGLRLSTGGYVAGALGFDVSGSTSRGAQVDEIAAAVRAAKGMKDGKGRREALDVALRRAEKLDFGGLDISKEEFLQAIIFSASAPAKDAIAAQIDQSLDSGNLSSVFRKAGPKGRKGRSGAGAANALANFGESAEEKIARIADGYNPAPRGLDKAFIDLRALDKLIADLGTRKPPSFEKLIGEAKDARAAVLSGIAAPLDEIQQRLVPLPDGIAKAQTAIKELDGVIAVLTERKPPNWEQLVERAQLLKIVAADTVNGPLNDMLRASREQQAVQMLVLQGREREAEVLSRIQQLTRDNGPLTADQRREVERMVASEERINDLLQKRQDIISIYMSSIGDLRGALEDLFSGGSGGDFLKNTEQLIKRFRGSMAVEAIFGDSLRALEKRVRGKTPLDREIDDLAKQVDGLEGETGRSSAALKLFTDAVATATASINRSVAKPHQLGDGNFLKVFGDDAASDDIVVTGKRRPPSIGGTLMREQTDFLRELARAQYDPLAKLFDEYLGGDFFRKLSPVFQGAYSGFFTAGPVGGILGAVKELPGLPDKLKKSLGGAFEGAQTGTMVAGLGKALGLKMSTTGSQVGGAVGSFLPIPGGEIIGSVVGGLLGGLFKKKPKGSAVITSAEEGGFAVKGNKAGVRDNLTAASTSVQQGLSAIAEALDATLGSFNVSIGSYKDSFRVSASGSAAVGDKKFAKRAGSDLLYEGKDANAAIAAALRNAIADGAIGGISAAMQKALQSSSDVDKAVREALKVREVEEILGGLGGSLERQFREFEAQAKERVRIATQYGFNVNEIEKRNAEDRAKLVDQILTSRVGSLQQLLEDMKFGDLFEGTAADRRAKLLAEIATAKGDADKGIDGAADRLADLQRRLVETSRDAYGTAGSEYASDRSTSISNAEAVIKAENDRIRAAQQATVDTSKAMQTQNKLTNEANDMLAEMLSIMRSGGVAGAGGDFSGSGLTGGGLVMRAVDLR